MRNLHKRIIEQLLNPYLKKIKDLYKETQDFENAWVSELYNLTEGFSNDSSYVVKKRDEIGQCLFKFEKVVSSRLFYQNTAKIEDSILFERIKSGILPIECKIP
ncbi:MAG: hypothetical protein DI535_19985 [Citrobacter freundii]|nr:MAG: hypothetical protein DI535_19985 [Citrobacter freundii]